MLILLACFEPFATAAGARSLLNAPASLAIGGIINDLDRQYSTQPAACRLIPVWPNGITEDNFTTTERGGCSGWLAGEKTIVSNGHCIRRQLKSEGTEEEEQEFAQALHVVVYCGVDTCEEYPGTS